MVFVERQQPVLETAHRVLLHHIREREDIRRVEKIQEGVGVAGRLREAVVEAAAPAASHVREHAVEDPPLALVAVEAVVEERA